MKLLPTCHEADPPEAGVQRHLDLGGLVLLQDDSLLHQQPVVCWHGDAHQQQTTGPENRREQRQGPRTERTHLWRNRKKNRIGQTWIERKNRTEWWRTLTTKTIHVKMWERGGDENTDQDWFNLLILNFKTCTSRSGRYGNNGEEFDLNLSWLSLTSAIKYVCTIGQERRWKKRGEQPWTNWIIFMLIITNTPISKK